MLLDMIVFSSESPAVTGLRTATAEGKRRTVNRALDRGFASGDADSIWGLTPPACFSRPAM